MPSEEISLAEYLRLQKPKNKYFAKRVEVDGIWFDSKAEGEFYRLLKIRERMGEIKNLTVQPVFPIIINEFLICKVIPDFSYLEVSTGEPKVVDVKSVATKTPIYKLKRKLFRALYGRDITEVM